MSQGYLRSGKSAGQGNLQQPLYLPPQQSLANAFPHELPPLDRTPTPWAVLNGCKAWLSSMFFHLIVILGLALLTMPVTAPQTVSLTIATDEYTELGEVEELTIDLSAVKTLDNIDPSRSPMPPELLALNSAVEFEETEDAQQLQGYLGNDTLRRHWASGEMGTASFFGVDASGDRIVYIVDRSGSMQGSRWQRASYELIRSIEQLQPDQKFFVFLFSDRCHPMPRLAGPNQLVPATSPNIEAAKRWILRQSPAEDTHPLSSVKRALRLNPDTIFLLTDGMFHDKTGPYLVDRAEMRLSTSHPESVVINTIAFHCDKVPLLMMLRDIAVSYSGTFRHVE